jgi:4'-phosphopantetheinyl transferase
MPGVRLVPLVLETRPDGSWRDCLPADEAAWFARQPDSDATRRRVSARAQVRQLLGSLCNVRPRDVDIATGPRGKPFLRDSNLHFSVSHSADRAILAVADRPVGVDLETVGRPTVAAASRVCAPEEQADLRHAAASGDRLQIARCWTRKEAWAKASGHGLGEEAGQVVTWRLGGAGRSALWAFGQRWVLADVDVFDGFASAVCCAQHLHASSIRIDPCDVLCGVA